MSIEHDGKGSPHKGNLLTPSDLKAIATWPLAEPVESDAAGNVSKTPQYLHRPVTHAIKHGKLAAADSQNSHTTRKASQDSKETPVRLLGTCSGPIAEISTVRACSHHQSSETQKTRYPDCGILHRKHSIVHAA